MSRIDYAPSRSPRRHSPIKYRSQRSRSRERYSSSRRSPFSGGNSRNRPPIHQRLSARSRSIEKRLSYPSKHEVEKRSFRNRSRSPRRRRRSSTRSNSRHRSRSRSRRKSNLQSRSRSKERNDRKFTFYSMTNEVNEVLLSKHEDNFIRNDAFNLNAVGLPTNLLSNELGNFAAAAYHQQALLDAQKAPLLEQKIPLIDKPPMYDNQPPSSHQQQFTDDIYFDQLNNLNPQLNQQLNQINQLKMNNSINNPYLNQAQGIPNDNDSFHQSNSITRSLRERLDVVHPSTSSNALLETPSAYSNHINTFNNHQLNNSNLVNTLNSPLNPLNSNAGGLNLNHDPHHHHHHHHSSNHLITDNNGYFNNRGGQDIDLRGTNNNNNLAYKDSLLGNGPPDHSQQNAPASSQFVNQEQNEKCMFNHLGCPITTNKDVISKHEIECLYNPRNVKAFCNKCKLTVCPEHDCINELRTELNHTKLKTNWCQNTIKLTNTSLLNNDFDQQVISIHYSVDNKEIVKQIKINKTDRMDYILKQAVDIIFTKENLIRLNKTDRDFQLICTGLYTFLPELSFNKSTKLQLPSLENHLHLSLIEKKLTVKVAVKRLFYQNQHIIVSVPASVPFLIDPTKRICDLKELISEKIPVQWDKHRLTINCKEYKDYQILYAIGLANNDRVEIEAY